MNSDTQPTLLERLRDGADPMAWEDFFNRYWRLIFVFAKRRGCSDHTAEEVVQDVMLAMFEKREVFHYDPARGRFHNWLATVVRNNVVKRRRQPAERARAWGGGREDGFVEPEAEDAQPDAAWEAAFEEAMLASLLDIVRQEVTPKTFQAFELVALHELPGGHVAEITGLSRNGVYSARRRVLARLRELGSEYRKDGQLCERLKQAMASRPNADIERSVATRIETTMRSR